MKEINVLYIIWALEIGGAERVVFDLARYCQNTKFRPTVCCLNWEGRLAEQLKAKGIDILSLGKRPKLDLSIIPKLVRIIRKRNIHVVHTHLWTANFWGRIAACLANVNVIIATEHNVDVWKGRLHFLADRCLSFFTDKIVFVSAEVERFYIKKASIKRERCTKIYNGIDTHKFDSDFDIKQKKVEMSLNNHHVISVIGRLVPQKGHRYFLKAIKYVVEVEPMVKALIVGDGECRSQLEILAKELGLENKVIFTGIREDVPELMKISDMCVLSSLREGFPITILEAMAAAKPLVATSVGGNGEAIVDRETGFLVPPGDPDALTDRIIFLLHHKEVARKMGLMGMKRVRDVFSVENMVEHTQKLYEQILRKKDITCH